MGLKSEHKAKIRASINMIRSGTVELLSVLNDPNFVSARLLQHSRVILPLSTYRNAIAGLERDVNFVEGLLDRLEQSVAQAEIEIQNRMDEKPGMTSYDGTKTWGITKIGEK